MVLFDAAFLVVHVQGRDYAAGEHPGAETARGASSNGATEKELDLIGTADVEVFPDDLIEEDATMDGLVEDQGEGELGLEDGKVVAL